MTLASASSALVSFATPDADTRSEVRWGRAGEALNNLGEGLPARGGLATVASLLPESWKDKAKEAVRSEAVSVAALGAAAVFGTMLLAKAHEEHERRQGGGGPSRDF